MEINAADVYVSRNACKDVTADIISGWYMEKPCYGLDDVIGMDELVDNLRMRVADTDPDSVAGKLKISPVQSYLFYGPAGTGKTFVAEAFISDLMKKGYKCVKLTGSDVSASIVGVGEKTLQIAFQEAVDNAPCVIFIDDLETVCVSRNNPHAENYQKRFTVAFLEAFIDFKNSKKSVVFVGATNYPQMVDIALRERINMVHVTLPDYKCRLEYIKSELGTIALEDGFELSYAAEATENYDFREMNGLICEAKSEFARAVMKEYEVFNEDGTIDYEASDAAAAEAVSSGKARLSKEIFDKALAKKPPMDKSKILAEYAEFEKHAMEY